MRILVIQASDRRVLIFTKNGGQQPASSFDNPVAAEEWLREQGYECVSDFCRKIHPKQQKLGFTPDLDYISGVYRVPEGGVPCLVRV